MLNKLEPVIKGLMLIVMHWKTFLYAVAIPMSVYLLVGILGNSVATNQTLVVVFALVTQLSITIISITTHRLVILGPDAVPRWGVNSIGWRGVKYFLAQYVVIVFFIPLGFLLFVPSFALGQFSPFAELIRYSESVASN